MHLGQTTPTRLAASILTAVMLIVSAGCYEKVVNSKPFPGMAYTGKDAPPVANDYSNAFESQRKNDDFFAPIGGFTRGVGNVFKGIGNAFAGDGDKPKPAASAPAYNSTPGAASAPPAKSRPPAEPPESNEGSLFDTAPPK